MAEKKEEKKKDPKKEAEEKAKKAFEAAMPAPGAPLLAARVGDNHICPMLNPDLSPHVGGPIQPPGVPTVLIGGMPAATVSSLCKCESPAPDAVVKGSATVTIGGLPAARLTDATAHGGVIVKGCPTVVIGG